MAWIESHTVLVRHRKLLLLAGDLGIEPVHAMGHLHALWHSVLEQQEDGDLSDWPDQMIAQAACYQDGDPSRFVAILQARKWLDGKIIHDWLDYSGRYLTNKYRNSNPSRLKAILKKHKGRLKTVSRQSKDSPKTDNLDNLTNHTLPNQDNLHPPNPPQGVDALVNSWNQICVDLPSVKEISNGRKTKIKKRLSERSLQEWDQVFMKIQNSAFCRGSGDRGWKATFDWIIANEENAIRVLEGKYDSVTSGGLDALKQLRKEEGRGSENI